jgi:HAD superfamily hydrolase (TIGR01509 family)
MQKGKLPITTVIFDLGGVYFTDGTAAFIEKMERLYGVPKARVKEIVSGDLGTKYRTGTLTPAEFWRKAKAHWQCDIETPVLAKLWFEEYKPIRETAALIKKLKGAEYEVLFLSDNASDRIDYLESKSAFIGTFDGGIFSHIEKTRKPDKKIYEAALKIASHPAAQCVYIDDKEELLIPANRLGMHTVRFNSSSQLEKDLRALGLKF